MSDFKNHVNKVISQYSNCDVTLLVTALVYTHW